MRSFSGGAALLAAVAAGAVACSSLTNSVNELPVVVDLAAGNRISLVDQRITLRFDSVVTDSRCPMGALCIQAGQAILSFSLTGPNAPASGRLLLASDRPDTTLGVVLSAEQVTPYRQVSQPPPDHRAYRVTLRISAR
jgi:hypothetical protein